MLYVNNLPKFINKRAQRPLCRSPEKKGKGNSGANYREHYRGKIWTTLVEDLLMMLYIKDESTGPCRDFWKFNFKTYLLTRDLLMQPTGMVWTTLIGDHPGIIPVKFGQIPISNSREDEVWSFPNIIQCNLKNFGRGPLDDAKY